LLNGCICCNLVGQLADALEILANDLQPDRIIIETSGSAFPATLAMEINRLSKKTGKYVLDGVMSVIDVENWRGYDDTSVTAKMQARYTDLIVLNKWECVSRRRLEDVEDAILGLEVDPPTPRSKSDRGWVDKNIIFGLDPQLAKGVVTQSEYHHDHSHQNEVEVLSVTLTSSGSSCGVNMEKLYELLEEPTKDALYRIKGILYTSTTPKSSDDSSSSIPDTHTRRTRYILNWSFGRWNFTKVPCPADNSVSLASSAAAPTDSGQITPQLISIEPELSLTIVTAKYEANKWQKRIESGGLIALQDTHDSVLTVQRIL